MTLPTTLNGFPVLMARDHGNGYVTVMVYREHTNPHPFVVATWWPELDTKWSWGSYLENKLGATQVYRKTAERNARRSA